MSEPRPDPDLTLLKGAYRDLQDQGAGCPAPEVLAALAVGERGSESERIADHVVGCRRCSEDMQVLLRTHAEASIRLSGHGAARRRLFSAVAAALAIVVLAGLLLTRRPSSSMPSGASVERGGVPDLGIRVTPQSGAQLDSPPNEFEWPPQSDAVGYRLLLYDSSGVAIWTSERASEAHVRLSATERARVTPGGSYFWVVEAEGRTDKTRLGPFTFRLTKP